MARIVVFTVGTEGDARPYVALGKGLHEAGHDVTLATSREFQSLVQAEQLTFAPLTADFQEMMRRHPEVLDQPRQRVVAGVLRREMSRMADSWAAEAVAAASSADLVIGSGNVSLLAASAAERLGIPFVRSQLQPFDPSRSLPVTLFRVPRVTLPGPLNLLVHRVTRLLIWRFLQRMVNGVRRDLGLPRYPWRGPWSLPLAAGGRILYAFSQHVVPRQPEWPARIALPGYFVLARSQAYEPPPGLSRFLDRGPRPIYVGFGSMMTGRSGQLLALILAALRQVGRRAVIGSGWTDLAAGLASRDDVCIVPSVPHEWLFSRVALAVHHCGAGTSAAAMRAGTPSVPIPFVGDQFFWAWQMNRLGVATAALDRRILRPPQLAAAIEAASGAEMASRAAELGARLRAEDGVQAAITQLRDWALLPPATSRVVPERMLAGALPGLPSEAPLLREAGHG